MITMAKGSAPAFQMYPGDRLQELAPILGDDEALAAWTRVFMYLWKAGPSPQERVAQAAGKGWVKVGFLLTDTDGMFSLPWMEEARAKQAAFSARQADNGAKGGRPKVKPVKEKNPNVTSGKPTENPERSSSARKIEDEESLSQGSEKEQARPRKVPDTRIDQCIAYFTEKAGHKPSDASKWLRVHVSNLLRWVAGKDPDGDPVVNVNALIDAALSIDFHRNNATSFRYLHDYRETIYKTFKNGTGQARTPTPDQAARKTAEYFARKRGSKPPEPTGDPEPASPNTADVKT